MTEGLGLGQALGGPLHPPLPPHCPNLLLPALGPPKSNPANSNTSQTTRSWVWFWSQHVGQARAREGRRGPGSFTPALAVPPAGEEASLLFRHVPIMQAPAPPRVFQLVLRGRMHKGHGCVHEHGHPLCAAARGGQLGWGAGASLAPNRSKLCAPSGLTLNPLPGLPGAGVQADQRGVFPPGCSCRPDSSHPSASSYCPPGGSDMPAPSPVEVPVLRPLYRLAFAGKSSRSPAFSLRTEVQAVDAASPAPLLTLTCSLHTP